MYGEIIAAANSLRAAGQIAKGLIDLKTTTEVQAKAIELNGLIIDAQGDLLAANAAQAALVEEVRELKSEIARMKDWEAQKQRYKLVAPFEGGVVYALQKSMSDGEPPHYICTSCYQNSKRSILQNADSGRTGFAGNLTVFQRPICRAQVRTGWPGGVPAKYAEEVTTP